MIGRVTPRGGRSKAAALLGHPRFEVFPSPSVADQLAEHLPRGETVTVTASPTKGLAATLDLAERLARSGYQAVPHLSARLIRDRAHLTDVVARLTACGVTDVFVPAGDADSPAGPFDSALGVLEHLTEMGSPFPRVGITGYPQSHPRILDDVTIQAMWDKRHHATYIVSNLCFSPTTLRHWITRLRTRGITLPLYLGLAGPVDRVRLLRMAAKAGIPDAGKFLTTHTEWFLRLGTPGAYNPTKLLDRLTPTLTTPEANIAGLHLFTFNQLSQTLQWRESLLTAQRGRPSP